MNFRSLPIRVFLIGSILLQVTFCVMKWKDLLIDPRLAGIDFVSFYTAGKIATSQDYTYLYNVQSQIDVQKKIIPADIFAGGANFSLYNHPPYLAPLFSLIANLDYVKAYMIWTAMLVVILILCLLIIYKFLLSNGWDRITAFLTAANCILFYPVLLSVIKGQDTALILFGLLLWMFGLLQNKEVRSGVGLALATLTPQIAVALALPSIVSRRRAG